MEPNFSLKLIINLNISKLLYEKAVAKIKHAGKVQIIKYLLV